MSCSSKKYLLADQNSGNKRLIEFINQMKKNNKINSNPVILVNEQVVENDELKNLKIFSSDILNLAVVEKGNLEMNQIYGKRSLNGVVLIETKPFQEKSTKSISESKVLFLVDGKIRTSEEIEKINPNDIETITVIKDKKEILKYTTENYDGVVIIEMKKK